MMMTAVLKMVLDSVPREASERCIHLTPFTVCLSGPCVTMAILRIQFVGAHVDFHKRGGASERVSFCKHLNVVPEGLVTELARVRQARSSLLLAASGHAEVTAAIGYLRRRCHILTGGRGRHPG